MTDKKEAAAPAQDGWLTVDSLDLDAQGVARRADGKVVFIDGALPFEQVSVTVQRAQEQLGAGHAHGDPPRVVAARAAALPALRPARGRLRRLQDAAPRRRPRRSRSSSACWRTTSGTWPRCGRSSCCGRSTGPTGITAGAPASRCGTCARRAPCWSASTSARAATWPTSASATSCPRHVSDLLLPLRALIGSHGCDRDLSRRSNWPAATT